MNNISKYFELIHSSVILFNLIIKISYFYFLSNASILSGAGIWGILWGLVFVSSNIAGFDLKLSFSKFDVPVSILTTGSVIFCRGISLFDSIWLMSLDISELSLFPLFDFDWLP